MPIPPFGPDQNGGSQFAVAPSVSGLDDEAFEAIGQTVRHAAGAIDGLKDILDRLQRSVADATEQRRNDIEIGQLFTRAQDFVEDAVTEGNELAQRIVADAEFEAARIIAAAKEEAHRLVEDGRQAASLPSEAVMALQSTIEEFSRMNNSVVQELSSLTDALTAHHQSRPVPFASPQSRQLTPSTGISDSEATTPPRSADTLVVPPPPPSPATAQHLPPPAPTVASASLRLGKSARNNGGPGTRWRTR
jgi:cell division septum initiation protein DivIVA